MKETHEQRGKHNENGSDEDKSAAETDDTRKVDEEMSLFEKDGVK